MKPFHGVILGLIVGALVVCGLFASTSAPSDESPLPGQDAHGNRKIKASPPVAVAVTPAGAAVAGQRLDLTVSASVDFDAEDFEIVVDGGGLAVQGQTNWRGRAEASTPVSLACWVVPDGSPKTISATARVLSGDGASLGGTARLALFEPKGKAEADPGVRKTNSRGEPIIEYKQPGK